MLKLLIDIHQHQMNLMKCERQKLLKTDWLHRKYEFWILTHVKYWSNSFTSSWELYLRFVLCVLHWWQCLRWRHTGGCCYCWDGGWCGEWRRSGERCWDWSWLRHSHGHRSRRLSTGYNSTKQDSTISLPSHCSKTYKFNVDNSMMSEFHIISYLLCYLRDAFHVEE